MLRRLAAYLVWVFEFPDLVARLRDERRRPQIPTSSVWISSFLVFALRYRSFNALEQDVRRPKRWESWLGPRKPSADTQGRVMCKIGIDGLRGILVDSHRRAWRNKAIQPRLNEAFRVVAIDGHELGKSRARCCKQCLIRDVKDGDKIVLEYYHRVVVAQWVGVTPPGILDFELILPGEGEVVAARRLLGRLLLSYGRLIDVFTADAIYLEGPFGRDVLGAGKHFVIVMKQEARQLYQDADGLRALHDPIEIQEGKKTTCLWDLPDLQTFTTLGVPVRVVWAEERTTRTKIIGGKAQKIEEGKTWIWVTDLPAAIVSPTRIARWGHDRWDLENRGFNELAAHWGMDHYFIHEPRGILALLLTLAIAHLMTYLFHARNLKPPARRYLSRLALACRLREDIALLTGSSVWPEPAAPD